MLAGMAVLVALALALWGASVAIRVEFFQNDVGLTAQSNVYEPGKCLIGIHEPRWAALDEGERQSIMLHEVGHCLGLGHYGSCNAHLSIMGCPSLGRVTEYDKAMLAGNRVFVPMVSN